MSRAVRNHGGVRWFAGAAVAVLVVAGAWGLSSARGDDSTGYNPAAISQYSGQAGASVSQFSRMGLHKLGSFKAEATSGSYHNAIMSMPLLGKLPNGGMPTGLYSGAAMSGQIYEVHTGGSGSSASRFIDSYFKKDGSFMPAGYSVASGSETGIGSWLLDMVHQFATTDTGRGVEFRRLHLTFPMRINQAAFIYQYDTYVRDYYERAQDLDYAEKNPHLDQGPTYRTYEDLIHAKTPNAPTWRFSQTTGGAAWH